MSRGVSILLLILVTAAPAAAQSASPPTLSQIFQELFGPNGLVVSSEDVLPDGSTHSAHFNAGFQSNFTQFNTALASQLTSLPLPSPASGFTYSFDAATGTFVRTTRSFGPILSDRAETIGRGRMSFGYNFQHFTFDELEGQDLSRIPAVFTHDDFQLGGGRTDVVATRNSITASVGQWTGALTYGLTDRLDLAIAVPVIHTTLSVTSAATIERIGTGEAREVHFFRDPDAPGGLGSNRTFISSGSASGIGDMILRVKSSVMREGSRALAVGLDARLPTGDERNLLGAGAYGLRPFVVYSASYRRLAPHVNLAYAWNGDSVLAGNPATGEKADVPDQVHLSAGTDIGVNDRFSMTVDVLGRRLIDSPRVFFEPRTFVGPVGTATFEDLVFGRGSFWSTSVSVGFKANPVGRMLIDFNLRFSTDDNGLTDRVTPLLGIEYGF
ncbi:MAG TPA: hypothetical protein VF198_10270 [Vicinamibacterales bacterium]